MLWQTCVEGIVASGATRLFELGPRDQIKTMIKRISMPAWKITTNITV